MILHAAKHPETAVNGVVLCQQQDGLRIVVTDYIPYFHSPLTLAPMLEVALHQTEAYCSTKNLRICGYFQANEHSHDNVPTVFACKIADKIHDKSGPACLVMLRNDRLYPPRNDCFAVYTLNQDKWSEAKYTMDPEVVSGLADLLKGDLSREICDFDDHLNDVKLDYFNVKLSSHIAVSTCD
ncbi:unnamed protein product [Echinostoma caproni]|uniref:MPN domain-containing protein n=1 Tax=Echinostoma caproni TaxID=27848 RepID=A0A183AYY3_9TREM|nr:unnamed protein product [Echinostoma caproni]